MEREIKLVKAFTKNKNEGNPAGVVLNANGLTDSEMVQIAARLGFSESAFVQNPTGNGDYRLRFFTPTQEVDLCGHATIAAFYTLLETGVISLAENESVTKTQESKAGILPVTIHEDGLIVMTQPNPQFYEPVKNRKEVADLLGIEEEDLIKEYPIQAVSTGAYKLMIPVRSRNVLFSIIPDLDGIAAYSRDHQVRGFHVFTLDTIDKTSDFHARQFNPLIGINEDPITGIAAGALGAYAVKHKISPKTNFVIEQGNIMNKPGKIFVEIGEEVKVGGYAVTFGTTTG